MGRQDYYYVVHSNFAAQPLVLNKLPFITIGGKTTTLFVILSLFFVTPWEHTNHYLTPDPLINSPRTKKLHRGNFLMTLIFVDLPTNVSTNSTPIH